MVRLQGVHLVGVLQGVLMVLRQGVPVGLRRVASVGPRMGALRDAEVHVVILVHVAPPGRLGLGRLRAPVGRREILILTFRFHGDVSASSARPSHHLAMSAASFIPVTGGEEGVTVVGVSTRWPPRPLGGLPLALPPSMGGGPLLPLLPVSASSSVILEEASPSKSFRRVSTRDPPGGVSRRSLASASSIAAAVAAAARASASSRARAASASRACCSRAFCASNAASSASVLAFSSATFRRAASMASFLAASSWALAVASAWALSSASFFALSWASASSSAFTSASLQAMASCVRRASSSVALIRAATASWAAAAVRPAAMAATFEAW